MRKLCLLIILISIVFAQHKKNTNDYFDNSEATKFTVKKIFIGGEVAKKGYVDFSKLPIRKILFKNIELTENGDTNFIGAYRIQGYSLHDILNSVKIKKKNNFHPETDLYLIISNDKNEKIVVSWGEVFHVAKQNNIIISNACSPIVPVKTKQQWVLPEKSELIFGNDFFNTRKIENPSKIIVKSYSGKVSGKKHLTPLYCSTIKLRKFNKPVSEIDKLEKGFSNYNLPTCFYGQGMGFHGFKVFHGKKISDVLKKYFPFTINNLKTGIFIFTAKDAYRCVYSYSEICNRNDNNEFLLVKSNLPNKGKYFLFAAPDFFSDRSIRSIKEIIFINE